MIAITEEDEPVAWIQPTHLEKAQFMPFLCRVEPKQRDDFIPLYIRPESARKPMSLDECLKRWEVAKMMYGFTDNSTFIAGVRFAEKHHGIGGYDD